MRIETILLIAGGVAAAWWVFGKGVLPDLVNTPQPIPQPLPQPVPVTTPGVSFFPGVPHMPNTPPTVN